MNQIFCFGIIPKIWNKENITKIKNTVNGEITNLPLEYEAFTSLLLFFVYFSVFK